MKHFLWRRTYIWL